MKWLTALIWLAVLAFFLTRVALPWAMRLASRFSLTATELSIWRIRGLEWRKKGRDRSAPPTLRIEQMS